jgi:hypothetical protein
MGIVAFLSTVVEKDVAKPAVELAKTAEMKCRPQAGTRYFLTGYPQVFRPVYNSSPFFISKAVSHLNALAQNVQ